MRILPLDTGSTDAIIQTLEAGGLVIAPSDTVYGVLVDASNPDAVKKLIAFKNRPWGKPISVFVADRDMMSRYAQVSARADTMLSQLLPGPFTVILPSLHATDRLLESERGTIGLRIPRYSPITDLVSRFGRAVTATSANLSGRPPHYRIDSLLAQFPASKRELIDLIIDAGVLPRNKPSTVVDLTTDDVRTLRHGDIVFRDERTFISRSPAQTQKLAAFILSSFIRDAKRPVVMILQGDLGAGKTVFVKGIAHELGIDDIVSPTYVIYYEYDAANGPFKKLYHFDLYQIEEEEEYDHLGIPAMLTSGSLLCFEWGEKSRSFIRSLEEICTIIYVTFSHVDEHTREITVKYS